MNFNGTIPRNSNPSSFAANEQQHQQYNNSGGSVAPGILSNQGQQQKPQESMNFHQTAIHMPPLSNGATGQVMSIPQQFQFQTQPSHQFTGDAILAYAGHGNNSNSNNSNNYTNAEGRNSVDTNAQNGRIEEHKNNDAAKGDFFTSVEANNPTQNVAEVSQRQRSLSVGSVGSFSMDGEENDMNLSDNNNAKSDSATTSRLDQNAVTQQKAPPIVNNNNSNNNSNSKFSIQTDVPENSANQPQQPKEEDKASSPPSTNDAMTQAAKTNGASNDNTEQLTRYETSLRALGTGPKVEDPTTTTQADTNAVSQDPRIPQQQQQQAPNGKVIELLDDDAENDVQAPAKNNNPQSAGVKRERPAGTIVPGSSLHGYQAHNTAPNTNGHVTNGYNNSAPPPGTHVNTMMMQRPYGESSGPRYFTVPPHHTPTWRDPLPTYQQQSQRSNTFKRFELSLLNLSEFTITGLPVTFDGRPSSCLGFRKIIKEVSKGHGKPVFERDNPKNKNGTSSTSSALNEQYSSHGDSVNPDGGKWRIPLGAYRAFITYLRNSGACKVEGIPDDQLKIASLGKARLDKGFPSAQKIISYGVPRGLATTLAPFQRGGVDFVMERNGRALIADDMGLGKTIQSIASMSIYHNEWPLLILTPSSARYHWAAEFNNWLGSESSVNKKNNSSNTSNDSTNQWDRTDPIEEDVDSAIEPLPPMRLLKESEIHVMTAGKENIFPSDETRIVICSYGLATSLVDSGKLREGLFRCAIVDESHMLKNMKTKRTSKLVPILHATNRCILLSGTPALARPSELWPQLKILSTEGDGWWDDEDDFVRKYVQRTSAIRRAELHTMLTGTVMIRRLKHNILKSLPKKQREKAVVDVLTPEIRQEFHTYMKLLREGKGVMAKIAKKHSAINGKSEEKKIDPAEEKNKRLQSLQAEYNDKCRQKLQSIRFAVQSVAMHEGEKENLVTAYFNKAKVEFDVWYKERVHELEELSTKKEEELDRKTILNKMYTATAKAKIPFIAKLVGKWLDDPTKGKLCIFAHHIYVLDEIVKLVGLSNDRGSRKRFIRIDGSTSPKERQAQIVAFQNDPDIRIAVLGITAAGVAVTLTASSTVWFTELFWTPALMIQAEDRCHRIGQNAAVKCLYFVASGTLDVLLWDLLEKKFRDLGEFVEGKEKMKIVVQRTYKSVQELQSLFIRTEDDDLEDDAKSNENEIEAEGDDLIKLENDLQDDIVQLAQEEMGMISQGEDNEDGGADSNKRISKQAGGEEQQPAQPKSTLGQTEDEAICLSDDDDEEEAVIVEKKPGSNKDIKSASSGGDFDTTKNRVLRKCRFYRQLFRGNTYGIQLVRIGGRLAVSKNTFGKERPTFGDILIAVNGSRVMIGSDFGQVCKYMKNLLQRGMVELTFLEDQDFLEHYSPAIAQQTKEAEALHQMRMRNSNKKQKSAPPANSEDVIEILDDDDD